MAGALTAAIAAAFSGGAAVVTDEYFEYTTLLLPGNGTNGAQNNTFLDGSTNNFTITRNGNTTQGTFSPFSQTGWGNYFDGSGDSIYASSANTANAMGTGDWTVEAFVYKTNSTEGYVFDTLALTGGSTDAIRISISSGGAVYFYKYSTLLTSGGSIALNTWNHIAVVRQSQTIKIYVNGTQVNTTYSDTGSNYTCGTNRPLVGINGYDIASDPFQGYISNLRAVKGVAVYTGAFTPPTSPLAATQSAGTNISAITGTQTSLLTCQSNRFIDNSTNNFTITRNGDTRVVAFSPFNPTASWSAATYGGSGYFDGSGDYLSAASNTALNLTGDYTVECWFYANSFPTQPALFGIGSDAAGLVLTIVSSKVYAYFVGVGNVFGSGGTTLITNSWNHIAIVRSGTTNTCYINGSQSGTTYSSSSTISSTGGVGIGRTVTGSSFNDWNGYVADFRIVKGTAVYTGAFTPPTAPLTAITNTSLLLNFTNAGIYDATSKNDLETVGNAQISTTQSKWGGSSMYFNATNPQHLLLNYPTSQNALNGAFTIDFWIYWTSGTGVILSSDEYSSLITILSTGKIEINTATSPQSTGTISSNTWTYLAFTRNSSGVWTLYINGSADALSLTNTATYTLRRIGGRSADNCINGYLQDFRVTKGYVRTITTPTAAFPTL